ncbi:MAG: glycosyltransferase family 2 protein [Chloroflexi bacterium AL-W]|nr:glycosyltransferase family 2 protein [Chloroflexi bacterium AL-N1]NOK65825.1 glycosyltransferase family 2 protein [Chloroflexi bacterium AL-N10]NOK74234.1 glycosyltransferase family 2 protein [Chloroflexi bacterium AL-N5]NOK80858.1 glycosyltransferase family 2 protein [Chloroflexi bacterium AL-W]NOK88492.1 glycosyltransferase family 2 protein [Chloroflexi bacterium AL-N15]
MAKRIGIFVIAYNAESTLTSVLERIPDEVIEKTEEIFVIDDCSADNTYGVGQSYTNSLAAAKLTVHRNPINLMYGGNQKRGYAYAIERGLDIVVLLHADGQYAPEVMQNLLEPLEQGHTEMVMGSRMLKSGNALRGNMPLYKFVGNKILTTTQNWLLNTSFSEFHSGYRAYSCHALSTINLERLTHNWHFDTQIILEFLRRNYRITEVPIPTYYGDEICHVNGIPYAYECIKATGQFAWNTRWRSRTTLPSSQRSTE